ncbi:uncharacterized protein EV422DRAFT_537284 [Fimicolochytrium jonesii]|uniref:uncharacterized protein n=1 Tax=Fimicolochytrium jonesii TaxID=1396493 RepID=UPI0022FE0CCA|nr:uncharacterized protein EV422DRAFT_537284 [Fimicolochytrium jonesii]KAI8818501.1 hypothetical protein EV422DRAFT_537284 [Fimicolochytrium jonesii]
MRTAREAMAAIFPLSESLWMEWIDDDARMAATPGEQKDVGKLYARAGKDYLSIRLWSAFLGFVIQQYQEATEAAENMEGSEENLEDHWPTAQDVREVGDQALLATQLHFTESATVWNTYRDFEAQLLDQLKSDEQRDRLRQMYLRRLQQPHAQLEETFSAYSTFESTWDAANYEAQLVAANALVAATRLLLNAREPYENALKASGGSVEDYLRYIEFEKQKKQGTDQFRIRTLYERALATHCLDATLWDAYIVDMMIICPVELVVLPIAVRAVRNCPWAGDMWSHHIRISGHFQKPLIEILDIFERGLAYLPTLGNVDEMVKLLLAWQDLEASSPQADWTNAEWAKTVVDGYLEKIQFVRAQYPPGDTFLRLERDLIHILVHKTKDIAAARAVYADTAKIFGTQSDLWLEYIRFERQYGTAKQARALFKSAAARNLDWPERVFDAWLAFEREEGDVEAYYQAAAAIKKQGRILQKRREQDAALLQNQDPAAAAAVPLDTYVPAQGEAPQNGTIHNKRQRGYDVDANVQQPSAKRPKSEGPDAETSAAETTQPAKGNMYEFHILDNKMAGNMLYITNLSPRTTETDLKHHFSPCGTLLDVILQPNPTTGALEAYLEFADAAMVRKGVALHESTLCEQTISVVRCKPEHSIWNFAGVEEKNKIYVANLHPKTEKRHLRELFTPFGHLREIRLMLRPTTAFAYIEFASADAASTSLAANGKQILGKQISVAISNPQKTKPRTADGREVYVTNLPRTLQKEDIELLFKPCGDVRDVRVMVGSDGRSRGTAFVEYVEEEGAKKAVETLEGTTVEGRVVSVSVPDPNKRGVTWR